MFRKVVLGISGGIDSAVSAFLLKEKGFKVLAVFMKNWDEFDERGHCTGEQDLLDAEWTCNKLGIEFQLANFVKDYWNSVFTRFLEDYQNGLTPNPDILCNRYIKFDLFYKHAIENLNYDAIATGHYARTSFGSFLEQYKENSDVHLMVPRDIFKDQTFFLAAVKRASLRRTMFPLDNYFKSDVKQLAKRLGLTRLTNKKESTGICFIGHRSFQQFINEYITKHPGNFIDIDTGQIVGQHEGIHQWTVGQRCRLASYKLPYFVAKKAVDTNTIYVAAGTDHPALYSQQFITTQINWLCTNNFQNDVDVIHCQFRFQHAKPLVACSLYRHPIDRTGIVVMLEKPLRAVTPGQFAVFYKNNICLGSARIVSATNIGIINRSFDDILSKAPNINS